MNSIASRIWILKNVQGRDLWMVRRLHENRTTFCPQFWTHPHTANSKKHYNIFENQNQGLRKNAVLRPKQTHDISSKNVVPLTTKIRLPYPTTFLGIIGTVDMS